MKTTRAQRRYCEPETVEPQDCRARHSAARVECGTCGKTFSDAAVVTDAVPEWSEPDQCFTVLRRLFCDHCVHLQHWTQSCKSLAAPGPILLDDVVVSGPGYVRDPKKINGFLQRHPQAAGVSQS